MRDNLQPGVGKSGSLLGSLWLQMVLQSVRGDKTNDEVRGQLSWVVTHHLGWAENGEHVAVGGQHLSWAGYNNEEKVQGAFFTDQP